MIYLFDTSAVSDFLGRRTQVVNQVTNHLSQSDTLAICQPVYYEILRGMLWRKASAKWRRFNQSVLPLFSRLSMSNKDWQQAARFWSAARHEGKQLSDSDLLLAALAYRLNALLVSSDNDFDALPITRQDWRA